MKDINKKINTTKSIVEQKKLFIVLGLSNNWNNKPYLSTEIATGKMVLVLNPKRDYRNIKKIMKAVKKRLAIEYGNAKIIYLMMNMRKEK